MYYCLIPALGKPQAVLSEEELEEKQANLTGKVIEMVTSKSTSKNKSRSFSSRESIALIN